MLLRKRVIQLSLGGCLATFSPRQEIRTLYRKRGGKSVLVLSTSVSSLYNQTIQSRWIRQRSFETRDASSFIIEGDVFVLLFHSWDRVYDACVRRSVSFESNCSPMFSLPVRRKLQKSIITLQQCSFRNAANGMYLVFFMRTCFNYATFRLLQQKKKLSSSGKFYSCRRIFFRRSRHFESMKKLRNFLNTLRFIIHAILACQCQKRIEEATFRLKIHVKQMPLPESNSNTSHRRGCEVDTYSSIFGFVL